MIMPVFLHPSLQMPNFSCPSLFSCLNQKIPLTTPTSSPSIPSSSYPLHKITSKRLIRQLFNEIPQRIPAYTGCSGFSQTFALLANSGQTLDSFLLSSLLKASSHLLDIAAGGQLHAHSVHSGLTLDAGVRTSLISFYSTVGLLDSAIQVFDEIPAAEEIDLPTWNAIMSAYSFHGNYTESLVLFSKVLGIANLSPIASTYAIIIKACASKRDFEFGKALHAMIVKDKSDDKIKMFNSIISLYSKCGDLLAADKVFDAMDGSNVVSWNAIISGHEQNGEWESALALFRRMVMLTEHRMVLRPTRITLLCVLNAISSVQALMLGREVHANVIRAGLEEETTIANSLINMYGKCSKVEKARLVFGFLHLRDIVSWNSMLYVFAQSNKLDDCFELFRRILSLKINPDSHTLTILLTALSSDSCMSGREIHGYLLRTEVSETLKVSAYNAVITMYANNNRIEAAKRVFYSLNTRDSYSWNAMIDGYSLNGLYEEAVLNFVEMIEEGLQCDHLTFSILFTACGRLASVGLGKQVHGYMEKYNLHCRKADNVSFLSSNNALVSMYSKCGSIVDASMVFQMMPRRDVLSWTAMISALANHGMAYDSIHLFEMMRENGLKPNSVTYLALLTACAHGGLIKEGKFYFNLLRNENEKEVGVQHYAAMVDLFGRAGQFKEAEYMVKLGTACLDSNHDAALCLWRNFLGACHAHKQFESGVRAGKKILEIEPKDETAHVLLSNLYASCGMWEDMIAVRKSMKEKGLKKEAGCSWVEIGITKHCFVAGDASHPNRKEIYEKVKELDEKFRGNGYVPMTQFVLHDVDEDQKKEIISCHSEKLAVTFALLHQNGRAGAILVFKNLRVCGDCHNWMKIASLLESKEIILRDYSRFHSFKDGKCSCGDYW